MGGGEREKGGIRAGGKGIYITYRDYLSFKE